jgi:hypothetical protein
MDLAAHVAFKSFIVCFVDFKVIFFLTKPLTCGRYFLNPPKKDYYDNKFKYGTSLCCILFLQKRIIKLPFILVHLVKKGATNLYQVVSHNCIVRWTGVVKARNVMFPYLYLNI